MAFLAAAVGGAPGPDMGIEEVNEVQVAEKRGLDGPETMAFVRSELAAALEAFAPLDDAAAVKKTRPARTRTAVPASHAPSPTMSAHTAPAAAPASPASTAPPASAAPVSCHPLTNGGNCYEPGEYCRKSDHGVSGVAGDGEAITCEDNDGWRWEPA
jgi:hypothetical protein